MGSLLRSPWVHVTAAFVLCLAALGPALPLLDFGSEAEGQTVASVLESRREGAAVRLDLAGRITRAVLPERTVRELSSTDTAARAAGYERLAWQARLPGLFAAALLLAAACAMGRAMRDVTFGWMTTLICGSSILFLHHARANTAEAYLAALVAIAGAAATCGLFGRSRWIAWPLWGMAAGAAVFVGGTMTLVYTTAPLALFAVWRGLAGGDTSATGELHKDPNPNPLPEYRERGQAASPSPGTPGEGRGEGSASLADKPAVAPVVAGILIMLALAGLAVLRSGLHQTALPAAVEITTTETRLGPARLALPLLPWALFLAVGLVTAIAHAFVSRKGTVRPPPVPSQDNLSSLLKFTTAGPIASPQSLPYEAPAGLHRPHIQPSPDRWPMIWCTLLLALPLAVLIPLGHRSALTALPLLAPAATLTAFGLSHVLRNAPRFSKGGNLLAALHWLIVAAIGVGLPALMASPLLVQAGPNSPCWIEPPTAALCSGAAAVLVVAGLALHRASRLGMAVITFAVMLLTMYVFLAGFRQAQEGQSPMRPVAERIRDKSPAATIYLGYAKTPPPPAALAIYTNRAVVVTPLTELAKLPAGDVPAVAVVRQKQGDPRPNPPAGWTALGTPITGNAEQYFVWELRKKPAGRK